MAVASPKGSHKRKDRTTTTTIAISSEKSDDFPQKKSKSSNGDRNLNGCSLEQQQEPVTTTAIATPVGKDEESPIANNNTNKNKNKKRLTSEHRLSSATRTRITKQTNVKTTKVSTTIEAAPLPYISPSSSLSAPNQTSIIKEKIDNSNKTTEEDTSSKLKQQKHPEKKGEEEAITANGQNKHEMVEVNDKTNTTKSMSSPLSLSFFKKNGISIFFVLLAAACGGSGHWILMSSSSHDITSTSVFNYYLSLASFLLPLIRGIRPDDILNAAGDASKTRDLEYYLSVKPEYATYVNPTNGIQPIHRAVIYGNSKAVHLLVEHAEGSKEDIINAKILGVASSSSSQAAAESASRNSDMDKSGYYCSGCTPLYLAYNNGENYLNAELIRFLESHGGIAQGPSVPKKSSGVKNVATGTSAGRRPKFEPYEVGVAAETNDLRKLRFYLSLQPDYAIYVNETTGLQPIHQAVLANKVQAVRLLLDRGRVSANARAAYGKGDDEEDNAKIAGATPLWLAYNHKPNVNAQMILALEENGGIVQEPYNPNRSTTEKGNTKKTSTTKTETTPIKVLDPSQIAFAAGNNNLDDLRELLLKYPDKATLEDDNGWQPIHEAARAGHIHSLKLLATMGHNVDFNAQIGGSDESNLKGKTPLWIAKEFGGLSNGHVAVRYLIENGAVMEVMKHEEKELTLSSTLPFKKQDQAHLFTAQDLRSAAYHGDMNRLEQILQVQPKLQHESDENGWMAIHEAVRNAQVDALRSLVDCGSNLKAKVGPRHHDGEGATPLAIALELHGEKHQITNMLRTLDAKIS